MTFWIIRKHSLERTITSMDLYNALSEPIATISAAGFFASIIALGIRKRARRPSKIEKTLLSLAILASAIAGLVVIGQEASMPSSFDFGVIPVFSVPTLFIALLLFVRERTWRTVLQFAAAFIVSAITAFSMSGIGIFYMPSVYLLCATAIISGRSMFGEIGVEK